MLKVFVTFSWYFVFDLKKIDAMFCFFFENIFTDYNFF